MDDVKTKYYTGLPSYELLQVVFSFVTIKLPASFQCSTVPYSTNEAAAKPWMSVAFFLIIAHHYT